MHRTAIYKRFTFLIIFLLYGLVSLATGGDSSGRSDVPLPFNDVFTGYTPKEVNKNSTANLTNRSFAQLDHYIAGEQFSFQNTGTEFTEKYFEEANTANTTAEEYKAKARAVLAEIQSSNSYIDYLEPEDINKLPIGIRKVVGNTEITIAISNAIFTDKYAKLTAFARIKIPQAPYELLFGISDLKLSYKGGIIGAASLVLLGDVAIPINGDNAALILKGSMDMTTGGSTSKTFITVSCKGFDQLGINGEIQFSRSLIVPSNTAGTIVDGRVTAVLDQILVTNWNDVLLDLTFQSPFQVNGLQGFNFTVTRAVFDFSDLHNSPNVVYPQGYQQKYIDADNPNSWRGVYVQELSLGLPKAIKDRDKMGEIVKFSVHDLLVDNNGISGVFAGENILPINKGTASGWQFSLDNIKITFEANNLIRAGFDGKVGLPVNQSDDGNNKRKFLGYTAVISANSEYVLRVTTLDEMDFDVWKAKVFLQPNSWVQISGNSTTMKPEAMLHGKMGIIAAATDENPGRDASKAPVANFQGITFRSLHLTVDKPYIDAEYLGYEGEVRLGNFPVSIYDIGMVKEGTDKVGIGFGLKVNLHENEFSGNASFKIWGNLNTERELTSWKYSKLEIGEIAISAKIKDVIKLDGSVKFLDDHPVYGDGFAGHIKCVVEKGLGPDPITVEVNATFGKTTFRYWYVDGLADLGTGIGGAIKIQGFGGGAYYRMKKEGFSTTFSATGAKYVPDENAGLGIKAAVVFSVGSKKLVKGEASFEVAFNKGGGLRYIGLFGFAKFMGDLPGSNNLTNLLSQKFKEVEEKLSTLDVEALNNMKIMQPSNAAKESYSTTERPGQTGLAAYIGIQYDFEARSLHATFDMYINAAKGMLTGAASENRAGWAVFHVDPKEWYLHVGRPDDRLGLKIGLDKLYLKTGSYLMAGYNIPKFPDPPSRVVSILREAGVEYENNINSGDVTSGRGFAFGTSLEVATGDVRFLFFYANFAAGLGFDVMIKDYGNTYCEGGSPADPIGINGWYAQGQAYAYLQGELGVRVKILFIKKNISIIKGSAAALLQAKLPNPTWVGGYMGFSVNILGGAIKGRFNFKFSFGNDCKFVYNDVSEYEDLEFITNITPDDQATNVSVLAAPQVKFTIKPGATLEVPREDGSGNDVFMPVMETFKMYEGSNEVAGSTSFNTTGDLLTFKPTAVLKSKTNYKAIARISIRQLVNGYWVPIQKMVKMLSKSRK